MLAETIITLFIGGFAYGLYVSATGKATMATADANTVVRQSMPFIIALFACCVLAIWLTFHKAGFAKFSWGHVTQPHRLATTLQWSLLTAGYTLVFYALIHGMGFSLDMPEMKAFCPLALLPIIVGSSFISAFAFFGAIFRQLLHSLHNKWCAILVLTVFYLPMQITVLFGDSDSITLTLYFINAFITLGIAIKAFIKTHSTIVVFFIYLVGDLVPLDFGSNLAYIVCSILGIAMLAGAHHLFRSRP